MASFASIFPQLPLAELERQAMRATPSEVEAVLARLVPHARRRGVSAAEFALLISPAAATPALLERLAKLAHDLTLQHFGRVVRFFAPLYLSNECVNICKYCGFSRDNPILRVTLSPEQVLAESRYLRAEGFRHLLLVAGEHPHFVSRSYLRDCIAQLHPDWPSIALEVGPLEEAEYVDLVRTGAEGLVVYQETYNHLVYNEMHVSGPKKEFHHRLDTAERAYAAGFKRLGIGALLGLAPWRQEALGLAAHTDHLLRHCWRSQVTISVPRLRPASGEFQPKVEVTDRELTQLIAALRVAFPEVGLVLSTREAARLRDGLVPLGITMMSAGSHTEPGGYTGQGGSDLHLTRGGRRVAVDPSLIRSEGEHATVQFEIADTRPPAEVVKRLATLGYEAVWKDWDGVLNET